MNSLKFTHNFEFSKIFFTMFDYMLLMAQIAVIVGSVRSERHGIKVAKWIVSKLEDEGHKVSLVDPVEFDLPLLDKMYKEMKSPSEKLQKLQKIIKGADGYIPITPEYNHSISSALKNTLDYFLEEYFFKPSAIVSYSVGPFGGVVAGNHLRQVLAEIGASAIPSQLPISKVHETFDADGKLLDENYNRRFSKFLDEFEWYLSALTKQRESGTPY